MKKLLLMFAVVGLFACEKSDSNEDEQNDLSTESWVLTEEYYDPGDGSGEFQTTTKSLSISWDEDNSFTATGNLCSLSLDNESTSEGTFNIATEEIFVTNCNGAAENTFTLTYALNGNELLVYFPCIEPCVLKFQKVIAL